MSTLPPLLRIAPYDPERRERIEEQNRAALRRSRQLSQAAKLSQTYQEQARRRRAERDKAYEAERIRRQMPPAWQENASVEEVERWRAEGVTYAECAKRLGTTVGSFSHWYLSRTSSKKQYYSSANFDRAAVLKIYNEEYIHGGATLADLSIPKRMAGRLFNREQLPMKRRREDELKRVDH